MQSAFSWNLVALLLGIGEVALPVTAYSEVEGVVRVSPFMFK